MTYDCKLLKPLMLLTAALVSPAVAQERPRIWLGAGVGGGGTSQASGAGVLGQLVYQKNAHHIAVRGLWFADIYSNDSMGELGVLYGRAAKRDWGHATAAAGLAFTSVTPCGSSTTGCNTLGVPVVVEAALRFATVVGLGAQVFVNLNPKGVYRGAALFLQLGWLP